jgi:hypothetical protein
MSEWRAVPGFEGWYEVSDVGEVRSLRVNRLAARAAPRLLKTRVEPDTRGRNRVFVWLSQNDKLRKFPVARLMLRAFVSEPPPGKPLARHLDDNATNNVLSNLAWGSRSDNAQDAIRNGRMARGDRHGRCAARRRLQH